MSLILAVDTASEYGSLALARNGAVIDEVLLHAPDGFAQMLYRHLAALLDRHGLTPGAVDCFAASSGPGSFTGVRIGLACVKGLAEAVERPAVAVSNLQALSLFGTAPLRATIMDARRGEIYGAVYDSEARVVVPETVGPWAAWAETLPRTELEFVSLDVVPPEVAVTPAPRALAGAVARLAARATWCDPAALDANYVRRSDAELCWKE